MREDGPDHKIRWVPVNDPAGNYHEEVNDRRTRVEESKDVAEALSPLPVHILVVTARPA
jgi:hypothetical protein